MYLVGMEVMVDVPQYTFAALLWLGRGIVLCVAGLLRIRGIVIGIGNCYRYWNPASRQSR